MLEQIEAVQRIQDYINAHLYEEITLSDLSIVSMFSPWYSYRLFTQEVELTPLITFVNLVYQSRL